MNQDKKNIIIVTASFIAYYFSNKWAFAFLFKTFTAWWDERISAYLLAYILVGLPLYVGTLLLHRKNFFESLGLNGNFLKAIITAFVFTLPMLVGYALLYDFNTEITTGKIAQGAVFAAFFEELFFRGFFFGLLFRYTRLGFIPSILLGAAFFASLHLYQSNDPSTMTGIFITTLLGAALFAWTYAEWGFNLWISIWLHLFMNLYWMLFEAGDNAFGPLLSNVFRASTIAFIIIGTLYYKRQKQEKLAVSKHTLWMKANATAEL